MANESTKDRVVQFTSEFKRQLRHLTKKYRKIKNDLQPLIDGLARGNTPGDQVPGTPFDIFKVRVKNSSSAKGKRGGFRVIYQLKPKHNVVLISMYSKKEQDNIAAAEIKNIIEAESLVDNPMVNGQNQKKT